MQMVLDNSQVNEDQRTKQIEVLYNSFDDVLEWLGFPPDKAHGDDYVNTLVEEKERIFDRAKY